MKVANVTAWAFTCLVSLSLLSGCNNESRLYPVSGNLSFADGSLVTFGTIEFRAEQAPHNVASGKIQRDGTFEVVSSGNRRGTVEGWHKVIIYQVVANHLAPDVVHNHHLVDRSFSQYKTTPLRIFVGPESSNEFDIKVGAMPN